MHEIKLGDLIHTLSDRVQCRECIDHAHVHVHIYAHNDTLCFSTMHVDHEPPYTVELYMYTPAL